MTEHRDYVNMRTGEYGTFDDHVTWLEERAIARGPRGASNGSVFFCDEFYGSAYCKHVMGVQGSISPEVRSAGPGGDRRSTRLTSTVERHDDLTECRDAECRTPHLVLDRTAEYACSDEHVNGEGIHWCPGHWVPRWSVGVQPVPQVGVNLRPLVGAYDCGVCENGRYSELCMTCGRGLR